MFCLKKLIQNCFKILTKMYIYAWFCVRFDKYATNHDIPEEPETLKFAHIVAAEQIDDFPDSVFVYILLWNLFLTWC